MRKNLILSRAVVIGTFALGGALGLSACQGQPANVVPTHVDPNAASNAKADDQTGDKTSSDDSDQGTSSPDGIELKPVGQGGGPSTDVASPTPKPANVSPPVKKPIPKPIAKPTSAVPPVWTPPPLPSTWTWPFPTTNAPAPSASVPPPAGSSKPDAGPGATTWTLPPFGG